LTKGQKKKFVSLGAAVNGFLGLANPRWQELFPCL
jgi:hypothetical protein